MLKRAWLAWKRTARKLGNLQARVLLTLFYAVVVLPFGLVARLFFDPLRIRSRPSQWLERPHEVCDLHWARKQ